MDEKLGVIRTWSGAKVGVAMEFPVIEEAKARDVDFGQVPVADAECDTINKLVDVPQIAGLS